jgi:hypothetical protein
MLLPVFTVDIKVVKKNPKNYNPVLKIYRTKKIIPKEVSVKNFI